MGAEVKLYKKLKAKTPKIIWNRIENLSNVVISNIVNEPGVVRFDLTVENKDTDVFFKLLTRNISNLQNYNFKITELDNEVTPELLSKLAVILFMLNKKIETKL